MWTIMGRVAVFVLLGDFKKIRHKFPHSVKGEVHLYSTYKMQNDTQ